MLAAAALAGSLSGLPSSVHAVMTGQDLLGSTRAAGTLLGRPTLGRGLAAHGLLTLGWTWLLVLARPARRNLATAMLAGLAIGCLDLGVARRRLPAISNLPTVPQLLDHVAFGGLVFAAVGPSPPRATSGRQMHASAPSRGRNRTA